MSNFLTNFKNSLLRLKYLLLLQIGEKLRPSGSFKKRIFTFFLKLLAFIAVTAVIFGVLFVMSSLFYFKLNSATFTSIILLIQVFDAFSVATSSSNVLFGKKENSMLLVYPCKHSEVFISKILIFIYNEITKSAFFLLPLLLAYGVVIKATAVYFIFLIPCWFLLCLFPVFIGTSFSVIITNTSKFLKRHLIIRAALLIVVLTAVFFFVDYVLSLIPRPIRIIAIYGKFMETVEHVFATAYTYSLYYRCLGNLMFGESILLNSLILLGALVAVMAICFMAIMPFFFKTASSSAESSSSKKRKVSKTGKSKGLFATFLDKEFKLLFRSSDNLNSAISVILVYPILIYVLNFILSAINTSQLGSFMAVSFNVMIITSLLSVYNSNASTALSQEGEGFALLKMAPSNTIPVCYAKMTVIAIVNVLAVITSTLVLVYISNLTAIDLVLMVATILCVSLGTLMWNFTFDVFNPKVKEYIVKGDSYTDNPNVSKSVFTGFIISIFAGVISLLLLFDGYISGWIRVILLAVAFLVIRIYLLNSYLKAYFNDMQI